MTEHCLCLHIMGRRRRSRWHDCGKHFAQPVKKKKKKNTAAQTETQYCLLFFGAHNVVTVSQNNRIVSEKTLVFPTWTCWNWFSWTKILLFPAGKDNFLDVSEWSHISVEQICASVAPLARPSVKSYRRNLHRVCCTRCTNVIFVGMGVKNAGLHVSWITFPNKQTSFFTNAKPSPDSAGAETVGVFRFRFNDADSPRSFRSAGVLTRRLLLQEAFVVRVFLPAARRSL